MIQVNRIYLIFNRLVTKKFLVDTSDYGEQINSLDIQYSHILSSVHSHKMKKVKDWK